MRRRSPSCRRSGRNVWSLAEITPGVLTGAPGAPHRRGAARHPEQPVDRRHQLGREPVVLRPDAADRRTRCTEVVVQTGSTSADSAPTLASTSTSSPRAAPTRRTAASRFYQGDALDARGFFEDRSFPGESPAASTSSVQMDGPVRVPELYDGRNRTFFMAAYEGIRRRESDGRSIATVPTAADAAGQLLGIQRRLRNPSPARPTPATSFLHPDLVAIALRVLQSSIRRRTGRAPSANLVGNSSLNVDQDQILFRADQNIGNRVRLYCRYNWQDEFSDNTDVIPIAGQQAAPEEHELPGGVHPHD